MKKKTLLFIGLISLVTILSCTDNQRARSFGGTETIKLEDNEEFVNITWKQDNLWLIVRDKNTGKYYAREKSSFGVMQGKVVIE